MHLHAMYTHSTVKLKKKKKGDPSNSFMFYTFALFLYLRYSTTPFCIVCNRPSVQYSILYSLYIYRAYCSVLNILVPVEWNFVSVHTFHSLSFLQHVYSVVVLYLCWVCILSLRMFPRFCCNFFPFPFSGCF